MSLVEDTIAEMEKNFLNESAWTYFSGKEGSKSEYFREHLWPAYLLFGVLVTGAVCNVFLVSIFILQAKNLNHRLNQLTNHDNVIRFIHNL